MSMGADRFWLDEAQRIDMSGCPWPCACGKYCLVNEWEVRVVDGIAHRTVYGCLVVALEDRAAETRPTPGER